METHEYKTYKYEELSEQAKEKAFNQLCDINVGDEWWDCLYEDAKIIGLDISAFDIDRRRSIEAEFTEDACYSAYKILENHGEDCETTKLAQKFISDRDAVVEKFSTHGHRPEDMDDELDQLEEDFLYNLKEEYLSMLSKEYDYLTSREAVEETIKINEYDFLEDGRRDY